MLDKLLPNRGNRNTFLTVWLSGIVVAAWIVRGAASGDWSGLEWVAGQVAIVSGASALRARGEYAYVEDQEEEVAASKGN